ncbi:PP2C family protein-serine/threonine phosphatase [Georgenia faecalis]|uniref:PP2C family protein-serine/threonine phosphatase n=1 Tax=Georgenia faecalis TaxID=2483799 RepID=UPI000FDBCA53|nr:PP2C family serine/threonine-protein phosphatase [Georgenia faecalis]
MSIVLHYGARSDVGLVRSSNQDSAYAGPNLLVLADGMGGPAGGDIASSVVVAHLVPLDAEAHGGDDLLDHLRRALAAAHTELEERAEADPELAGLGTTCIAILRSDTKLAMVHIGDSRAYLLRGGELTQVTADHTFVQHLVDLGKLTPDQAERHPQRSVLLRVLGDTDSDVLLDESVREGRPGDRWLLCSDGLSGVVSPETIAETLRTVADPGECAEDLIALALRAGGPDNVTCVVADVLAAEGLPDGAAPPTTPQVVGAAATDRLRRTRGTTGAAGRAAALAAAAAGPAPDTDDDDTAPRSSRGRWIAGGFLVLVLLAAVGAAGVLGYRWTQSQYFLAPADDMVAIYQGIPQEVGPLSLATLHETTDVALADLPGYARDRLGDAITVSSLDEAQERVEALRGESRPATTDATADAPADPSPSPSPSPSGATTGAPAPAGAGAAPVPSW